MINETTPEMFDKYCKDVIEYYRELNKGSYLKLNITSQAYEDLAQGLASGKTVQEMSTHLFSYYSVLKNELTSAEKRYIELERKRCTEIKAFYDEYKHVIDCINQENGMNHHWQHDGIVYQVDVPKGTYIEFKTLCINRTRYNDDDLKENDGSLSLTKARELGYVVEGKSAK